MSSYTQKIPFINIFFAVLQLSREKRSFALAWRRSARATSNSILAVNYASLTCFIQLFDRLFVSWQLLPSLPECTCRQHAISISFWKKLKVFSSPFSKGISHTYQSQNFHQNPCSLLTLNFVKKKTASIDRQFRRINLQFYNNTKISSAPKPMHNKCGRVSEACARLN